MEIALCEFDRLFDSVVELPQEEPGRVPDPPAVGSLGEQRVRQAIALFYRGDYRRCLTVLRDLDGPAREDPRVTAFLGASRALALGEVHGGLASCVSAVRRGFFLPDVYCALGVVLLRTGNRAKAFAAFQRGLAVDPGHAELRARTRAMGRRRRPVLPFLARSHPVNRLLGRVRAQVLPSQARLDSAPY